jgi:putative copper export protein
MNFWLLFVHLLGAAIWTGGHLVLALGVLPLALRRRDPGLVQAFEERYEPVGLVALATQLVTGIELTRGYFPGFHGLTNFDNPIAVAALTKLGLLLLTVVLAVDARLRIIPRLGRHNLNALAWHIIPVTLLAVALAYVGLRFRFGGITLP